MPPIMFQDSKLDAGEQLWFNRQLEFIKGQTYDIKYAELMAAKIIPVSNEAGSGARKITYRSYDMVGAAQVIANYAKDFKRVDILAQEFTSTVESIGDSYEYSLQDIRASMMTNVNLEQRRANAAVRAIAQLENTIAFFGLPANNLPGLFTNTNIPIALAPADGSGASSSFDNKTADQIIRDVSKLINDVRVTSKNVERANTVLLPLSVYTTLKNNPRSTLSDKSILQWLMDNHSGLDGINEWIPLNELETAGTGSTRMMVAYNKNPEKLTLEIPQPFEVFPPQVEGLQYKVPCHERIGGVLVYYPLSLNFVYGI